MNDLNKNRTGYKHTSVGWIPADWEVIHLKDVSKIIMGQSPDSENYNTDGNGVYLIQGGADIKNRKTSPKIWTSSSTKVCEIGDIIMTVRAPVGSIAKSFHKACIGRGVCAIQANSIEAELLYQILLNKELSWKSLEQGSTFTAITGKEVSNLKIAIPLDKNEQKKLADLLSNWDKAIENTENLIITKELLKKDLMQKLLTGKKRLPGFNGEWKKVTLNDIADFENGKAHENYITEAGQYIVINSKFISTNGVEFKRTSNNLSPLSQGDIVMVMSDIPKGKALAKCYLVNENNKFTLNQRICAIRPFAADNTFLYYLLNRNRYYLDFDSGVGQTNLRKDEVLECPLKMPTIEEQAAIAEVFIALDKEIDLIKSQLELYRQQKKGLMQVLLTGAVRVKV